MYELSHRTPEYNCDLSFLGHRFFTTVSWFMQCASQAKRYRRLLCRFCNLVAVVVTPQAGGRHGCKTGDAQGEMSTASVNGSKKPLSIFVNAAICRRSHDLNISRTSAEARSPPSDRAKARFRRSPGSPVRRAIEDQLASLGPLRSGQRVDAGTFSARRHAPR
jgi:hypothetical protein